MKTIQYRELRKRYEMDGAEKTVRHLSEAITNGDLKPGDFSLRDLAEGLIPDGHVWVRELDPRSGGGVTLREAIEAVDVTAFMNVAGKVIESKILESYKQESFVASKLVDTIPTRFETDRIPSVTPITGEVLEIAPGMPYPTLGFGEDYTDTPRTTKRGLIVAVTKEAIFFDRTHLVLARAAEVGEVLGLNKEKRILDVILGVKNCYSWRDKPYNTYYTKDDANAPWINSLKTNELIDWKNVDKMETAFTEIKDPFTNDPVLIEPNTVLIMPGKKQTAAEVFQAANFTYSSDQSAMATVPNTYSRYNVLSSRLAYQHLIKSGVTAAAAQTYWYMGDFRKAFAYMENWPITVTHSPMINEADFTQDIVVRYKASERGAVAVLNPRYVGKSTN